MIWQCTCDARVECDMTSEAEARMLVLFVKDHERCAATWVSRWGLDKPPGDGGTLGTLTERRIGFGMDDDEGDRA